MTDSIFPAPLAWTCHRCRTVHAHTRPAWCALCASRGVRELFRASDEPAPTSAGAAFHAMLVRLAMQAFGAMTIEGPSVYTDTTEIDAFHKLASRELAQGAMVYEHHVHAAREVETAARALVAVWLTDPNMKERRTLAAMTRLSAELDTLDNMRRGLE